MSCSTLIDTKEITLVAVTTATSGGVDIISAEPILEKGVVWSANENPTIFDEKRVGGTGRSNFDLEMSPLDPSKTYYVRAYAITKDGVSYGQQFIFTTEANSVSGCIYSYNIIPAGTSYIVPPGAELVSVSDDTGLSSACISEFPVDSHKCYGFHICHATSENGDDANNTDNYESITYLGFIIEGVKIPFNSPVTINIGGSDPMDFGVGLDLLKDAINLHSYTLQGIIKDPYVCAITVGDQGDFWAGKCGSISFKILSGITKDMRLYGAFSPQQDGTDQVIELQFPVLSKADMLDQQLLTLCNCESE